MKSETSPFTLYQNKDHTTYQVQFDADYPHAEKILRGHITKTQTDGLSNSNIFCIDHLGIARVFSPETIQQEAYRSAEGKDLLLNKILANKDSIHQIFVQESPRNEFIGVHTLPVEVSIRNPDQEEAAAIVASAAKRNEVKLQCLKKDKASGRVLEQPVFTPSRYSPDLKKQFTSEIKSYASNNESADVELFVRRK